MTAEEIKTALRNCSNEHEYVCNNCPARLEVTGQDCGWYLPKIALDYIRELEAGAMKKEETK